MPKPIHVARQHLTKGSGVSDMTFAAAPGALDGDHQVLAVATFMGINVATPSGWTLLGTYAATTYTRATLFTRVLNTTTAAAGFTVSSVSDVAAAEVRTLRNATSVAVVTNGAGVTTNTAVVPSISTLVHYWSASFSNETGSQSGAISPSTGLEEATPQYTMTWFNGLVSGIDPTSPDTTAPTRTATKPNTASIQWVTVKIVGTVDTPVTLVEKIDSFAARVRTQFNNLTLNKLSDVDTATTAPINGQALIYDSVASLWKPGTSGGGSGGYNPVQLSVARTSGTQTISASTFTTVTYNNAPSVDVGGGTFSNGLWTVPATGRYLILGQIRSSDSVAARSLALAVHTSNADGAWATWTSFGGTGSFSRNNASYQRIDTFNTGDVLRMFVYSDGASLDVVSAKLTIDRIG